MSKKRGHQMGYKTYAHHIVFLCLPLLFSSCIEQHPYTKEGKEYGITKGTFHGRWWNYYERGTSFLAGKYYEQAERDLLEALRGRSRDTWNARTYGLHFVEYFPNRELGITYYHMDRLDDAERYLRTSLEQVDTERARRYLDLITKRRIELGQILDQTAPSVAPDKGEKILTASRSLDLKFHAADDVGLANITLDDQPMLFRGYAKENKCQHQTLLEEGNYKFVLAAEDLAGKKGSTEVQVEVDLTGPCISILTPQLPLVTQEDFIPLKGAVLDSSGIASVLIDEKEIQKTEDLGEHVSFEHILQLNAGENKFVIIAQDKAGNETRAAIEIYKGNPSSFRARLWRFEQKTGEKLNLASTDPWAIRHILTAIESAPEKPVQISIKYPKEALERYRKSELRLAGRVDAVAGLKQFFIAQRPYQLLEGAKRIEFSRRLPVKQGENRIDILAEDLGGNQEKWETIVRGEPVMIDEEKCKLDVSVQHFKGATGSEDDLLLRLLEGELLARKRFDVITRVELEKILDELHLGSSALADPQFAARLGKIRPAAIMLFCTTFSRSDSTGEILCQVIETETARLLHQYDILVSNVNDDASKKEAITQIAIWLETVFPRLSGEVTAIVGKNLYVNLGSEDKLDKGTRIVVAYEAQPAERDPDTGEITEQAIYAPLGYAPVIGIEPNRSKLDEIRLFEGNENVQPAKGFPVFTM